MHYSIKLRTCWSMIKIFVKMSKKRRKTTTSLLLTHLILLPPRWQLSLPSRGCSNSFNFQIHPKSMNTFRINWKPEKAIEKIMYLLYKYFCKKKKRYCIRKNGSITNDMGDVFVKLWNVAGFPSSPPLNFSLSLLMLNQIPVQIYIFALFNSLFPSPFSITSHTRSPNLLPLDNKKNLFHSLLAAAAWLSAAPCIFRYFQEEVRALLGHSWPPRAPSNILSVRYLPIL